MTDISSVSVSQNVGRAEPRSADADRVRRAPPPAAAQRPSDEVELSDRARLLGQLKTLPEIREDLVAKIRQQIEDGNYETQEKLEAAVQRMVEDLTLFE
jgi:negative regulator of flagellin synthesis FlgM